MPVKMPLEIRKALADQISFFADNYKPYHSSLVAILHAVSGAVAEEMEDSLKEHILEWVLRRQTAREIRRSATQAFGGP